MATLVLVVQKHFSDNRRLLEAKRRARLLTDQAKALPQSSPRRAVLLRQASPATLWTLQAAMVPVGLMLGILLMPFVWLEQRVDPSVTSPPAGSAVQIVALVKGDWKEPVRLEVPSSISVEDSTPLSRTLPPLRATLERLLVLLRQPREVPGEPWELKAVPDLGRDQTANDLESYLAAGIPPQGITWLVRPPDTMDGSFPISVTTPGIPPLKINVVLGDNDPPAALSAKGNADSPLVEVRVVCPRPKTEPIFWRPFARLGTENPTPFLAWLGTLNVGWLWIYIIAYMSTLMLMKRILRVA
jgi:hypothetical protein